MNSDSKNFYYLESHEWVLLDGDIATIGLSDHVQGMFEDIVYIELPEAGRKIHAGDIFGVIESTKMASDLFMPISGTVLEKNELVETDPGLITRDAYEAWLIKIEVQDATEIETLLDSIEYRKRLPQL